MFFYTLLVVLIFSFLIFSYKYPKQNQICSLLLLGILIVIGGFRDRIGWDYGAYTSWYLNGTRDDGLEFGFVGLMDFFRYFKVDYHFLFFFFSFTTYLFVYLGVRKYSKETTLPLVLYVLVPVLYLYSFTYIRQFLSVAIAFYAFSFLLEKRYVSYFLLMLIGVSMHYSCLIPFFLFGFVFVKGDKIKWIYLYMSLGISFVISQIGFIHLLSYIFKDSHYGFYVSQVHAVPVPLLKLLVFNSVGVGVVWFYKVNGFENSNQKYFLTLYILSIVILNLFSESTELTRIYIYFRIFEILIISTIIKTLFIKKKHLLLIGFISCFYLFPYFRAIKIDYDSGPEGLKLIPYKTLLWKVDQ